MMRDLCAVGDLKWLVVLLVPSFPRTEEMIQVRGTERLIGNDAAIVSLLAARLGMSCRLCATNAVALQDGQPLLDVLQRVRVAVELVDRVGSFTPTTFFLLRTDSDERAWLVEDCSFHLPVALNEPPDYHFAYLDLYEEHLEERLALLHKWSLTSVRTLVNLSSSHLEEKVRLLVDIPSLDILQLKGSGNLPELRHWGYTVLRTCHAKAVIITLGANGVLLMDQHSEHLIAAEPIQPLRTMGAGASFSAGLLFALSKGASYLEAATFASKQAAAFCTTTENPLEVIKP